MEVTIVEMKELKLIGMSIHTLLHDVGETGPALHTRFNDRIHEIQNRINPTLDFAVSTDPSDYNDDTDEFKLMIGVEVTDFEHIPSDMEAITISDTFASVVKTDNSTFPALIRWVNNSPYELADIYSIEIHDHSLNTITLLFPVKNK